jgi:hypothetical protein
MEFFHLAVLSIASIIFIISLTTIGVVLQKGSRADSFPPFATNCPDGWNSVSGRPIRNIANASVTELLLTVPAGTASIPIGTIVHGSGLPGVIIVGVINEKYNLSSGSNMSGKITLIEPNTDSKAWYTCVAPENVTAATTGTIAWDNTGNNISYDDNVTSICDKRKWTMRNNIVWDGVSNYNGC